MVIFNYHKIILPCKYVLRVAKKFDKKPDQYETYLLNLVFLITKLKDVGDKILYFIL